ncbi:unnamed protein product [Phytophthora lilii]|uniref:Unnamed protein product n=1 Tax=Phytophthora lilii TaxID=2077276 RepID=A0A9W6WYT7_9STRA|nr:unnamed protein product [Phytophthora lilii]
MYPEIKPAGTKARASLLIVNRIRLAYDITVYRLLGESEINVAAARADEYKNQFDVDRMPVVNFVPAGHSFDSVYRVEACLSVEVVPVVFSASYDTYSISYLPQDSIPQEKRKLYFGT